MKDKTADKKNKPSAEETSTPHTAAGNGIVVEEQVLERHHYDNTTSFQMDIEKAKAMATSQQHTDDAGANVNQPPTNSEISEEEKERLKQSLAELLEMEQEQFDADEHGDRTGLFGKIKNLFSKK